MDQEYRVKNIRNFSLYQIADSGQSFRWIRQSEESYTIIALGALIQAYMDGDDLVLKGVTQDSFEEKWAHYFDLDRDYDHVKASLRNRDSFLDKAIEYGSGIRILNQDLWEMMITFIISANNNIPRIKNSVQALSETYGDYLGKVNDKPYYSFPKAEALAKASITDLRKCGLGYRDRYIKRTSQMVLSNEVDLELIMTESISKAKGELMKCMGIGNKVADCILLFACGHVDAFPVDTWLKKVLKTYFDFESSKQVEVNAFIKEKFGRYSGIAQQYLFYYIRNINN